MIGAIWAVVAFMAALAIVLPVGFWLQLRALHSDFDFDDDAAFDDRWLDDDDAFDPADTLTFAEMEQTQ